MCASKPEPSVYLEQTLPPCHELEFCFLIPFFTSTYFWPELEEQGGRERGGVKCRALSDPVLNIPSPVISSSEEEEDLEDDMEEEQEEKKEASRKRKKT